MATNLDVDVAPGMTPVPPSSQLVEPVLKESDDTMVRKWVAYILLALMAAVIFAAFSDLFFINAAVLPKPSDSVADAKADAERLMQMMNLVFGPVVTLVSSVVGFYFGARTAKDANSNN